VQGFLQKKAVKEPDSLTALVAARAGI